MRRRGGRQQDAAGQRTDPPGQAPGDVRTRDEGRRARAWDSRVLLGDGKWAQQSDNVPVHGTDTGNSGRCFEVEFDYALVGQGAWALRPAQRQFDSRVSVGRQHSHAQLPWAADDASGTRAGRDRYERQRGGRSHAPAAGPAGSRWCAARRLSEAVVAIPCTQIPRTRRCRGGRQLDPPDLGCRARGNGAAVQTAARRGLGVRKEPSVTALTFGGVRGCDPDNPSGRLTTGRQRRCGPMTWEESRRKDSRTRLRHREVER